MVKIRLMRMGKRKQPYFRVVVADSRSPRDGRFIENIGKYHPRAHPSVIDIDEERALHWLRSGAQPSDPVRVLLQKTGIWSTFTGQAPPEPAPDGTSEGAAGGATMESATEPVDEEETAPAPGIGVPEAASEGDQADTGSEEG